MEAFLNLIDEKTKYSVMAIYMILFNIIIYNFV